MVVYISTPLQNSPSLVHRPIFSLNTHLPCLQVSQTSPPPLLRLSSSNCRRRRSTASAKSRSSLVRSVFRLVPRSIDLTILRLFFRYHRSRWLVFVSTTSCRVTCTTKSWATAPDTHFNKVPRTELLLSKGYEVHGIIRRSSSFNTNRLHHLYADQHERMSPRLSLL